MLRNPLAARTERRTSAMLTRVGWEPPQAWPVLGPGATPLILETRLPAAEFLVAGDLPPQRRDALASVGGETISLAQAAQLEHVFLAAAICSTQADHGVLATMTAALTADPLPFLGRNGTSTTGRRTRGRKRVKGMANRVTMAERQEGNHPDAPLVVQYVIAHRYGALTLTFVTAGPALAGNARRLFQNIVRGCRLGPAPST